MVSSAVWHPNTQMSEWSNFDKIVQGKGMWLIDSKGNKMLDGVASMWCNVWGHSNPEMIRAINNQMKKLQHCSMFNLTNEPVEILAKKLVKISPGMHKVFFSDNGSSAMEIAFKMALQYWEKCRQSSKDKDCNTREWISRRHIWCHVCRICTKIFQKIQKSTI